MERCGQDVRGPGLRKVRAPAREEKCLTTLKLPLGDLRPKRARIAESIVERRRFLKLSSLGRSLGRRRRRESLLILLLLQPDRYFS